MNERDIPDPTEFECVDPLWGRRLEGLDDPGLDAAARRGLEDHLTICDACRRQRVAVRAVVAHLERQPQAGGRARARVRRWTRIGGGVALAASLVLAVMVAPAAPERGVRRDGEGPVFLRPVEGEVVHTATPRLSWRPVPGATAYEVEISQVEGDYIWRERTSESSVRVPPGRPLPADAGFRGIVRPVPHDLAGPTDLTVAFERRGLGAWTVYRLRSLPPWIFGLAVLGVLGVLGGAPGRRSGAPAASA